MNDMAKFKKICAEVLKFLENHPRASRVDIEMALAITYRDFEEVRDMLGKQIVSERVDKQYYFSLAPEIVKGEKHG